ncbi:hypothetical protein IMZ08_04580 [Bacillus luteolus]|uniref:Translocation protein TolB n=1 Tax=Litchfieldia luteola TaxID=682179 RepID=A0ABR9QFY3_9BACI|nr:hypothetical protein [Cytobacillus luteolus]MBE4907336.1 hypothetical protein [Cytobacillus luteolus]MBP1943883.1 hypothetical protein [Cytobacillus luteolus]
MKRIVALITAVFLILPTLCLAQQPVSDPLRAAYIKNNHLWIINGENQKQITTGGNSSYPKWSFDGKWLAYLKGNKKPVFEGELWLYSLEQDKHFKLHSNSKNNFQWAPATNRIAYQINPKEQGNGFQSKGQLYMADVMTLTNVQQIYSTTSNFSWLPDGSGFLVSTKTGDKLDSDIELSQILLESKKIQPLVSIPVAENEYFIATSPFKWSKDNEWIAFLLIPTASLSADSNTLCIVSKDGKLFTKADKMLNHNEWIQWSPTYPLLGAIIGEGRESTSNKSLKLHHPLYVKTEDFTPANSVDRDLTWINNEEIVTARSIESEWLEEAKRPLPALYKIDIHTQKQTQFSTPSKNEGDFRPQHIDGKVVWVRTNRENASIWISASEGTNQKEWISTIDIGNWYYDKWDWDEVFGLYIPR